MPQQGAARRRHRDLGCRHGESDDRQEHLYPRPLPTEATPCTQMGILQAAASLPTGDDSRGSVITVQNGASVTIAWLNIRYGDAAQGGGIFNDGELNLLGVTLYDNMATTHGGAIYNNDKLTVVDSTLTGNSWRAGRSAAGIYNTASGHGEHQLQHPRQFRSEHL